MSILSNAASLLSATGLLQANRLLDVLTPLGKDTLVAESLEAVESIGHGGFSFDLTAVSSDAFIDLKTLVGEPLRLSVMSALGRDAPRVWHGHVTAAELVGANGGLARYRLHVEPWLAFLRGRRDSFAFQGLTVFEIIDKVFADYREQGRLVPAWRWDVLDRSIYPKRSLTTQYRETDFAFVERLLAEEGLFYWFEHTRADDETLGAHTLVIADHNDALLPNVQSEVRFHRADATEAEDTVQAWRKQRRWQTHALKWASWDYRSVGRRPVSAEGDLGRAQPAVTLSDTDYPGQYAYEDVEQGERLARNALAARQLSQETFEGAGTVRTFAAGTRFDLVQHWADDAGGNTYVLLSVTHHARNNLGVDLGRVVQQALDPSAPAADEENEADFYRNEFRAVNVKTEVRPATRDEHGLRLHPRPTVIGAQTALVVADDGPLLTDRDHRIKVQFHWQRGDNASSRLAHPSGEQNAPASGGAGTWVRVAEPVAGGDWGGHNLPRAGQEVLVEFMHGDIDRPVVVGALYNGAGTQDGQYNQTQSGAAKATGNAPAWFAGGQGGHAHNAVLSGIKTQALSTSGAGTGGYNQLVFDDTPAQGRISLSTTQADSRLNLGHLKYQRDNERLQDLGHGAELATRGALAVRAGQGLLVSAAAQQQGLGSVMDASDASSVLVDALAFGKELAGAAQSQDSGLLDEGEPDQLPALAETQKVVDVLAYKLGGDAPAAAPPPGEGDPTPATQSIEGGQGSIAAFSEAHLHLTAPAGIAQYTPEDAITIAGENLSQMAKAVDWVTGRHLALAVASGASIYAAGRAGTGPIEDRGVRLHAAQGRVSIEAQDKGLQVAALKTVAISSTQASVEVLAPQRVLATAGGAFIRVEGGNIQLHAPGRVELKAASHAWVGPQTADGAIAFDEGAPLCEVRTQGASADGGAVVPIT